MSFISRSLSLITVFSLICIVAVNAQIIANADAILNTEYSGGLSQDNIYIFCGLKGDLNASLEAQTNLSGTIEYEWQKYNSNSGNFQAYSVTANGGESDVISGLDDGAYRVIITNGIDSEVYTAWVFNNYYEVVAEIAESNCDYFVLNGAFDSPVLTYYDLNNNQAKEINKNVELEWLDGDTKIASLISPVIYDPPTANTNYKLNVTDRFACGGEAEVIYESIVTKAAFSVDADFTNGQKGEAPLDVQFNNESENGSSGEYEWFFFRNLNDIKEEAQSTGTVSDSIDFVAYNDDLAYTYEKSGTYMVKLVSKKLSDFHTCVDTFYLEDYIVADTSFVEAPNFFTPNGDGSNDRFVVKFWSVETIKISIFNRWGKKVHFWESSNVRGFGNTVDGVVESVWDGRIGNRMASPGVYYYVVEARGRDDKNRWAHGFFHLFRGRD